MSERSGSPCSDRNTQGKKKKIFKLKNEQSEKISESGQSKLTHFFRNVQKRQKSDTKPTQKILMSLQAQLDLLKQQQQNLIYEKEHIQQQQLVKRQQTQNWLKRSKYFVQDCVSEIYSNIRQLKGKVDPQKGFYDSNCRVFIQGPFRQTQQTKRKQLQNLLNNQYEKAQVQKQMIQDFLQNQNRTSKLLKKQLNDYKQRLKNAHEQKSCKFVDIWPLLKNRYQVVQLIGKGGFSEVYKAYDLDENKYVAIKRSSTAEFKIDIEHYIVRQYENHLKLNHPNIAKLLQVVQVVAQNSVCIAVEYCEGPELSTYLKQHQKLPQNTAKYIMLQILEALNYLSSLDPKIIHFDLKPQNIMFSNGKIKILDFGLSKQIDNEHSKIALSNQGMGTYWYLPPEAFHEKNPQISQKVDVWSAGVIMYQMLFGKRPFGHNKSQSSIIQQGIILDAHQVEFPDDTEATNAAKSLIRHCLTFDPNKRYSPKQALSHSFFN